MWKTAAVVATFVVQDEAAGVVQIMGHGYTISFLRSLHAVVQMGTILLASGSYFDWSASPNSLPRGQGQLTVAADDTPWLHLKLSKSNQPAFHTMLDLDEVVAQKPLEGELPGSMDVAGDGVEGLHTGSTKGRALTTDEKKRPEVAWSVGQAMANSQSRGTSQYLFVMEWHKETVEGSHWYRE